MMIFTSFLATLPICRTDLFCVFCPPSPLPVSFLSKPRSLFAPHACSVPDLLFAFHGVCRRHPSMLISHWLATCCLSGSPGSFPLLLSCSGFFSEVLRYTFYIAFPVPFSILQTLPFVAPPPHFLHLFPPPCKQILPSFRNCHGRIAPRNFPFFVSKQRHEFSLPICRTLPFFTFSSPGFPFCRLNSFRFLSNPTFLSLFSQCPHLHAPHFRCKNQAFAATNKETVCLYLTIYIYFTLLK